MPELSLALLLASTFPLLGFLFILKGYQFKMSLVEVEAIAVFRNKYPGLSR